jgi:hypothetical protein
MVGAPSSLARWHAVACAECDLDQNFANLLCAFADSHIGSMEDLEDDRWKRAVSQPKVAGLRPIKVNFGPLSSAKKTR